MMVVWMWKAVIQSLSAEALAFKAAFMLSSCLCHFKTTGSCEAVNLSCEAVNVSVLAKLWFSLLLHDWFPPPLNTTPLHLNGFWLPKTYKYLHFAAGILLIWLESLACILSHNQKSKEDLKLCWQEKQYLINVVFCRYVLQVYLYGNYNLWLALQNLEHPIQKQS